MAKDKSGGNDKISTRQNVKMGDIHTAAKASMGPTDYSQGYPLNEGALMNTNFSGKSKNPGGK